LVGGLYYQSVLTKNHTVSSVNEKKVVHLTIRTNHKNFCKIENFL
jgi:hypothetical protein